MSDGEPDWTVPWNSQFGEDAWLVHNLLWRKRNGFFLEMGAMDGVSLSNTLWLHRAAGWRGLLVEACPEQYAALASQRRDSIAVHAAVCAQFQTVHWLSAANVGGIWEFMAQGFKDTFHAEVEAGSLPEVACVPMTFILDRQGGGGGWGGGGVWGGGARVHNCVGGLNGFGSGVGRCVAVSLCLLGPGRRAGRQLWRRGAQHLASERASHAGRETLHCGGAVCRVRRPALAARFALGPPTCSTARPAVLA
jgi:hypothetical protein